VVPKVVDTKHLHNKTHMIILKIKIDKSDTRVHKTASVGKMTVKYRGNLKVITVCSVVNAAH